MNQVQASIISNDEIMPGVYLIWLESPQVASDAQPGQFIMVRCGEDCLLRRPLSIHQLNGNKLALLFNIVGKGTLWLSQRQVGDALDLLGPLGNGYSIHPTSHNLLLLAGGIGIAPLCLLSQKAIKQGCSVTMLLGTSTATQLYPKHLLPPEVKLITITEDGTAGKKGMLTDLLPDFVDGVDQVFACGPLTMYRTMSVQKQQFQGKSVQISLEVRMGCGLGVCYGCTIKTKNGLKQVCKDGPIFNLDDVLWEELNLAGV